MAEQTNSQRSINEIGHLFLSSVREQQAGQRTPPRRQPPPRMHEHSVELTADELAQVLPPLEQESPPIVAVLASHLGARQLDRVQEYAAHLCASAGSVGLIVLDAGEFRLTRFDARNAHTPLSDARHSGPSQFTESLDARRMSESLHELSADVVQWVILVVNPRATEARQVLRAAPRWVLLTTCDHDGIVASYRTLKGLADLHKSETTAAGHAPHLSLALLDAHDMAEADHVFAKLSGVSEQFLNWSLHREATVQPRQDVSMFDVLMCRSTRDKAQLASAPQWQVVSQFVETLRSAERSSSAPHIHPAAAPQDAGLSSPAFGSPEASDDVIDLPLADASPAAVIDAVMHADGELVECPIRPPMSSGARLAVSRERRLVLVAAAGEGLADLRSIGLAYRWLIENRQLITMALRQFAIDGLQHPQLKLLVNHSDAAADVLATITQSGNVSIRSYRTLRWAGRTGLLLEAA